MPRGHQHENAPSRIDLVEWIVVTLILTIGFFALLQVIGDDVRSLVLSIWQTLSGRP